MTERKPPDAKWESWIERQIREAQERGEFDDLPGAGQPIPDLDRPHDELWWLKRLLQREQLEVVPETLGLRRELGAALEQIRRAPSEKSVRRLVAAINVKITEVNARATGGPPSDIALLDADEIVTQWRRRRE